MANMRYVKYAIVTVLFASLISIAPSISYSQLVRTTVEVDKSSYSIGETVSIGGIVPKSADGVPVVIQVFNPRNVLYSIDQVMPAADGSYSSVANIGGKLGITGTYTVKAIFSGQSAKTTFEFTAGPAPALRIYDYEIKATLSNGNISRIQEDEESISITINVNMNTEEDGILEITLPREVIDAKFNGQDDEFIVLVDSDEEGFEETVTTSTSRTLRIPVHTGSEEIEIIGTQVIPEFGIIAALVLAAALSTIIVASRKNQILNVLPR